MEYSIFNVCLRHFPQDNRINKLLRYHLLTLRVVAESSLQLLFLLLLLLVLCDKLRTIYIKEKRINWNYNIVLTNSRYNVYSSNDEKVFSNTHA